MTRPHFTDDFKIDAIKQITERGYSVADVSKRLGVSTHSLYAWMKRFSKPPIVAQETAEQSAEIRRLKRELARVTEERDILKKATVRRPAGERHIRREGTSPRMQNEVHFHQSASPDIFDPCDVSLPSCSPERILRLAEEPALQKGRRRCPPDRSDQRSLEG